MASQISDEAAIAMTEAYGAHNYKPLHVNIVRAEGAEAWDGSGKRYIDCIASYSAVGAGHLDPRLVESIQVQLERLAVTSRAVYTTEVALLMKGLAQYAGMDMVCPMNTGAEAVETCIKLARKWAYTVKGVPTDRAEIIATEENFHGRTTTIVGFSTEESYKEGFGPFTPGFKTIPFGDIAALDAAITPNTAAFLAEPIQAEGGINMPPDGYMQAVRKLCDERNVLLIWDEVQTGFCRTGKRFAWQWEDAMPDLMAVGKPLGGGLLPVSAAIGKAEVVGVFTPGDHGSTFGGNPLGAAVALTALAVMETEDYAGMSLRKGERLMAALRALDLNEVLEIRGRGLLIGVEVRGGVDTKRLGDNLLENGILTKETRNRTFRLTPPVTISDSQLDEVVEKLEASFRAL